MVNNMDRLGTQRTLRALASGTDRVAGRNPVGEAAAPTGRRTHADSRRRPSLLHGRNGNRTSATALYPNGLIFGATELVGQGAGYDPVKMTAYEINMPVRDPAHRLKTRRAMFARRVFQ